MNAYRYNGPVLCYDKVLTNSWTAETYAESKAKAMSNFKYQFKKYAKILPSSGGINLAGKITSI